MREPGFRGLSIVSKSAACLSESREDVRDPSREMRALRSSSGLRWAPMDESEMLEGGFEAPLESCCGSLPKAM